MKIPEKEKIYIVHVIVENGQEENEGKVRQGKMI